jgi:stearoyl-CoA desaturase (Delta-9 desaturase)
MAILISFFILHWYLSLFAQSFFHHRYAAHGAFTMSKGWEKFFFIYSFITQGSSYMSPRVYGIMHRMHHAYTDTENDPHSPSYDSNLFKMMWRTSMTYRDIMFGKVKVEERFLKNLPEWKWFDWMGNTWSARIFWMILYSCIYVALAPSAWWYLLIPVHIAMGPVHGVIINWFAHKYGEVNFETDNTSKNLFKVDLLMMGEGYHNNHHKYPSRANFAAKRGEFDPIYPVIKLMRKLNIIKIKNTVEPVYQRPEGILIERDLREIV